MASKIIGHGAEAIVHLHKDKSVTKTRLKKSYRVSHIDEKLRKLRTRGEAKLLERAAKHVNVPRLIEVSEGSHTITLEHIPGEKLADILSSRKDSKKICKEIGRAVAKLHDNNIIHGDLTTSNILLTKDDKIWFIDFGLGFYSERLEDRAVDIHLIKQALEAKHFKNHEELWRSFLEGYKESKFFQKTLEQLGKVEARGRYRH